jgi:hypothetical protein
MNPLVLAGSMEVVALMRMRLEEVTCATTHEFRNWLERTFPNHDGMQWLWTLWTWVRKGYTRIWCHEGMAGRYHPLGMNCCFGWLAAPLASSHGFSPRVIFRIVRGLTVVTPGSGKSRLGMS